MTITLSFSPFWLGYLLGFLSAFVLALLLGYLANRAKARGPVSAVPVDRSGMPDDGEHFGGAYTRRVSSHPLRDDDYTGAEER